MTENSTGETLKHTLRVGSLMVQAITELSARSVAHDLSKTESPEREVFDEYTPKLKTAVFGSEEYQGFLAGMKPALDHHYAHNRHHPEHFLNGVDDMTLVDLIEMLADWKASTERTADGSLDKGWDIRQERFGLSDQLVKILQNTAVRYRWMIVKPRNMPTAWCRELDDRGAKVAYRQGRHEAHEWFDVTSVSDLWCYGNEEDHLFEAKSLRAGRR